MRIFMPYRIRGNTAEFDVLIIEVRFLVGQPKSFRYGQEEI